jgi:hypothetical protein
LTFGQALELALNRNGTAGQAANGSTAGSNGHSPNERFCPVHLQDYTGLVAQLASANEMGLPPTGPFFSAYPAESSAGAFTLRSRKNVILCTALLFAKLEGIQAQELVLRQQQRYVYRLFDIESRRVSADVDHPLLLINAKLLRARTRMESAALSTSERKTRAALSGLIGLPLDQVGPVENSMPPLPDNLTGAVEDREALQQLMAYRDIIQLDYVSEYTSRLKATHDMALAKASIGSLVAAHITEEIKFIALLHFNNEIRAAKIQFLGMSDDLEAWAFGRAIPNAQASAPLESPASDSSAPPPGVTPSEQAPPLLSILIAPAIKDLQVGKSQQYSAIATYSNGHARDVTSEANWSCSSDTGAVLSSTGLLTGLSVGVSTVHVEFQGLTRSRKLSITEQSVDEYLEPDHRIPKP